MCTQVADQADDEHRHYNWQKVPMSKIQNQDQQKQPASKQDASSMHEPKDANGKSIASTSVDTKAKQHSSNGVLPAHCSTNQTLTPEALMSTMLPWVPY